jgi:type IV secretion system protein VirB11
MTLSCPNERIVILEDTAELQCVAPDHLALRTPAGGTLAQLVKATLRANPDRIVVGEVRDEAALDLLDAWATGHPGGVATLHARTPEGALLRLDRLAQRANVPSQAALIAEAIEWIVVMTPVRKVKTLARVIGWNGFRFHVEIIDNQEEHQCELALA